MTIKAIELPLLILKQASWYSYSTPDTSFGTNISFGRNAAS